MTKKSISARLGRGSLRPSTESLANTGSVQGRDGGRKLSSTDHLYVSLFMYFFNPHSKDASTSFSGEDTELRDFRSLAQGHTVGQQFPRDFSCTPCLVYPFLRNPPK